MISGSPMLFGLVLLTTAALGAAIGWSLYCKKTYSDALSSRGKNLLTFVLPAFLAMTASPVADVAIMMAGGGFPTIGPMGVVVGAAGTVICAGYVYADINTGVADVDPAVDGSDTAA